MSDVNERPTPRGSRFVPRVRWLVAATLLLGTATLWLTVWLPYQRRINAMRAIRSTGAPSFFEVHLSGPGWLRKLTGTDRLGGSAGNPGLGIFDRITKISLSQSRNSRSREIGDEFLVQLQAFPELEELDLGYTGITDDGLRHLAGLRNLKKLNLAHTKLDGSGFVHLRQLPELEIVNLAFVPCENDGFEILKTIPTLKTVGLIHCGHLTPDAVAQFQADRPDVKLYGLKHGNVDLTGGKASR